MTRAVGEGAAGEGGAAGLCDSCRHQRLVPNTRGSVFSLCERSRTDPGFPRLPAPSRPPLPRLRAAAARPGSRSTPIAAARWDRARIAELVRQSRAAGIADPDRHAFELNAGMVAANSRRRLSGDRHTLDLARAALARLEEELPG